MCELLSNLGQNPGAALLDAFEEVSAIAGAALQTASVRTSLRAREPSYVTKEKP